MILLLANERKDSVGADLSCPPPIYRPNMHQPKPRMSPGWQEGPPCHPERSEGSPCPSSQTLRFPQGDMVRSLRLMPITADLSAPTAYLFRFRHSHPFG